MNAAENLLVLPQPLSVGIHWFLMQGSYGTLNISRCNVSVMHGHRVIVPSSRDGWDLPVFFVKRKHLQTVWGMKKHKCFSLSKQLPALTGAYGNPAWKGWRGMKGQEGKCAVMIPEDPDFRLTHVLQINQREVFNFFLN